MTQNPVSRKSENGKMIGITKVFIRLAANFGLGIVLSILVTTGFGWFGYFTLTQNAKREDTYQEILRSNQEIVGNQIAAFSHIQLQQSALLQKHDERSKEFLDNEGTRREKLVVALNDLTLLLKELRSEIHTNYRRRLD